MNRNVYWIAYLSIVATIVMAYTGFTIFNYYQYSRLTKQVIPETVSWSINKLAEDDFALHAYYEFNWNGKNYSGHLDRGDHYLNAWASREALDKLNRSSFKVWFDPNDPSHSSLFKDFPLKFIIYTVILWLLLFYFIWLGYSVRRHTH